MSAIAGLRRPEFTGRNRCWPCTMLNVAILAVGVVALGWFRPVVAVTLAVVGSTVIYLRGYLVPYTPRFAPELAAALPGDWFDHAPTGDSIGDATGGDADPEAVLESLVAAGVVVVDGDQLAVSDAVATAWRDRMDALANSPDRLVDAAEGDVAGIEAVRVEDAGSETYLVATGATTTWVRLPVAVAEVGAVQALADTDLPAADRSVAAHALCAFLETCPVCGSDVVEGPADDCCGYTLAEPGREPPTVLACETCGVVFYTLDGGDGHST